MATHEHAHEHARASHLLVVVPEGRDPDWGLGLDFARATVVTPGGDAALPSIGPGVDRVLVHADQARDAWLVATVAALAGALTEGCPIDVLVTAAAPETGAEVATDGPSAPGRDPGPLPLAPREPVPVGGQPALRWIVDATATTTPAELLVRVADARMAVVLAAASTEPLTGQGVAGSEQSLLGLLRATAYRLETTGRELDQLERRHRALAGSRLGRLTLQWWDLDRRLRAATARAPSGLPGLLARRLGRAQVLLGMAGLALLGIVVVGVWWWLSPDRVEAMVLVGLALIVLLVALVVVLLGRLSSAARRQTGDHDGLRAGMDGLAGRLAAMATGRDALVAQVQQEATHQQQELIARSEDLRRAMAREHDELAALVRAGHDHAPDSDGDHGTPQQ